MAYYVIYKDNVDCTLNIMECGVASTVEGFIEVKINEQKYSPEDFKVVQGAELPIEITPVRARIMLKEEISKS